MPVSPIALDIRTVVFPTDGTAWADHALDQAAWFTAQFDSVLHVLTVRSGDREEPAGTAFREVILQRLDPPRALGYTEASVEAPTPEEGIIRYAAEVDADLIVMATHGRKGLAHWLDGSVAEGVTRRASCPVLTTSHAVVTARARARRILAPTDFSDASYLACAHAVALARLNGATLDLLHVVETQVDPGLPGTVIGWGDEAPHHLEEAQEALVDFAAELVVTDIRIAYHVVNGTPAHSICDAAERLGADLIVAGSHGRTGLRRWVLGSVAERLIQRAPCPVFVVNACGKSLLHLPAEAPEAESSPLS